MDYSQGMFDAIMDSAVLLDKTGRVINWNAGAAALFGYTRKEVNGWSINFIYERNYHFPKLIQEVHTTQKRWQLETTFIRKNGTIGTCKSFLCPLPPNDQNKVTALLVHLNTSLYKKTEDELYGAYNTTLHQLQHTMTDFWSANLLLIMTMNKMEDLERRLRESDLRFHLLAENATDVISRHKPDGTFLYVSPASKHSLGYEPDELMSKKIHKIIHHDDSEKIKKAFTRRRENPSNKPLVYRVRRKEGEMRWFESNIRIISDNQSRGISEIQLASRDITDRILDKKARLRGQQLAHVFRLSTMEEMASGMAHEICQPLAAIVNFTRGCVRHMQQNTHDQTQIQNIMEKAAAQAERAGEIVQRLKNFFCKGQLIKTNCKVNNVIRETATLLKHELTTTKTKVDFNFDKTVPQTYIDKIQMQQVLLNLMTNAMEAMNQAQIKEKRINIQTKVIRHFIEITVTDTGPGFSKEIATQVFTPFFTTKSHGRGMGLAICRSIIEAHGGQFTINPNTNNNSWIRFSLPLSI